MVFKQWSWCALLTSLFLASAVSAAPIVVYNSVPAPLAPNYKSLGYAATGTSEFGDLIQFAGTTRALTNVTVLMSDWAVASDYASSSPTWSYPITLKLYNVDNSGATPQPGTLIATKTQTFAIPWRPAADPTCATPSYWRAGDGNCYGGIGFTITFDMTGTVVPNQIIYSVSYNTQTYGAAPTGTTGPYNSLNVALASNPPNPTVGTNPLPDTKYWNTVVASYYTDGGAGGTGTFRQDTGWSPDTLAAEFDTAEADLSVTKTGPAAVVQGGNIAYNVTVTNSGPGDAQTVTLTDTLPANTTFVSAAQNNGPAFACTTPAVGAAGTVTCTIASLAASATANFTLTFNVNPATTNGATISNVATIASTTFDPAAGNNSATASATVSNTTDLAVVKSGPATSTAGANVTYTVTVTNNGPTAAQNVSLTDATPANTTFVSATQGTGPAFTCTKPAVGATGNVTCTIATLASGASASFTIVDKVATTVAAGTVVSNTATVSMTNADANAGNNSATSSATIAADVPALGTLGLMAVGLGLLMVAFLRLRP